MKKHKVTIEFNVYEPADKIPANRYQVSKKTGDVYLTHDAIPLADIGLPEGVYMRVTKWGTIEFSAPLSPRDKTKTASGESMTIAEAKAKLLKVA